MLIEHVLECVDGIYEDMMSEHSMELEATIHKLEKVAHNDTEDFIKKGIMLSLTMCLNQVDFHDELFEGLLNDNLEHMIQYIPDMKKSMTVHISVRGLEEYIYRRMNVPCGMTLADLAYYILAAFRAEGHYLFTFVTNQGKFGCDRCEEEMIDGYAADMTLTNLDLQKGSQLTLWYDFGDDYYFDIEILDIESHQDIQSKEDVYITSGEGYGIWEDEHQMLDLYYHDHEAFIEAIDDIGLDEDDFIFDEFDKDTVNELLFEEYDFLQNVYENFDESY